MFDNSSLVQLVQEPTRKANVLDILLTNRSDQVLRVDILPVISDHDIVFSEMDSRSSKQPQKPRMIPLYKKANWDNIRQEMKWMTDTIESKDDSDTAAANSQWESFRDTLSTSIKTHIPLKKPRSKDGYP